MAIWYFTPIDRPNGQTDTWNVHPDQTQAYDVFFGTQAEYNALADPDRFDIVIIDTNNNGLVNADELRIALAGSTAPAPSDNQGYLGTGDVAIDEHTSDPSAAYATGGNGIESSTTGILITVHEPDEDITTITPTYEGPKGKPLEGFKGGVGNFKPFYPGSLDNEPVCFVGGTLIETPTGPKAIETLVTGDLVLTADHGPVPLRLALSTAFSARDLERRPQLRPIRISRGALGQGLPKQDLLVSPQHRMLVRSRIAQRMFGTDEVLVAAKQLLQLDGIDIATDVVEFSYFHLVFDQHELVNANGALSESLYLGHQALQNIGQAARDEIYAIFPHLREVTPETTIAARALATGRMGRKLAVRHAQNRKPLYASVPVN